MPRRKKTIVNLNELECYPALIEVLRNNPDFSDKDLTTLKLTVFDSYEATIKEVDKARQAFSILLRQSKTLLGFFNSSKVFLSLVIMVLLIFG